MRQLHAGPRPLAPPKDAKQCYLHRHGFRETDVDGCLLLYVSGWWIYAMHLGACEVFKCI